MKHDRLPSRSSRSLSNWEIRYPLGRLLHIPTNVVQEERPKSVHVGNKLAELFQVSGVLTKHDRSDGSTCLWGNHERLDWWDWVDPSSSVGNYQELDSRHHSTNMAKDASSSVGGHGASCCIEGCFKGSDLGCSGPVSRGNAGDGVGNSSCHGRKYFGMEYG